MVRLPNTRSGAGRSLPLSTFFMWSALSPWQVMQVGVRGSRASPMGRCASASAAARIGALARGAWALRLLSGRSSSSWHSTHLADASRAASVAARPGPAPTSRTRPIRTATTNLRMGGGPVYF